jgi:hypothetical protein
MLSDAVASDTGNVTGLTPLKVFRGHSAHRAPPAVDTFATCRRPARVQASHTLSLVVFPAVFNPYTSVSDREVSPSLQSVCEVHVAAPAAANVPSVHVVHVVSR